MGRKKIEVRNLREAEIKVEKKLKEVDEVSEEAQKIVEDLEKVTKGLQGVLKGGISLEDNRKLEEILKDAKYVATKQFENANEKRKILMRQTEEWRDTFYEALKNKEVDEEKLDAILSKLNTRVVETLVRKAVEMSKMEKEQYGTLHRKTDREIKEDESIKQKQEKDVDIYKSINVKVG